MEVELPITPQRLKMNKHKSSVVLEIFQTKTSVRRSSFRNTQGLKSTEAPGWAPLQPHPYSPNTLNRANQLACQYFASRIIRVTSVLTWCCCKTFEMVFVWLFGTGTLSSETGTCEIWCFAPVFWLLRSDSPTGRSRLGSAPLLADNFPGMPSVALNANSDRELANFVDFRSIQHALATRDRDFGQLFRSHRGASHVRLVCPIARRALCLRRLFGAVYICQAFIFRKNLQGPREVLYRPEKTAFLFVVLFSGTPCP